ncbi:sugar MFS transporter [Bowmanella pacifica]|uniref:Glucose/galactose MFS transporter n=1 Tax=Bowmanella pacifica TaxID=502051 RepID=A0A917YYQ2_9ALTE|nr:sugar MFS transporter [Bowmanella pacifica]GGO69874.1 glucose/galactose MFS transporter [Bowmanella pacifica]
MNKVCKTNGNNIWLPMLVISILFFLFGFVTWLNGSLIPFLRIVCELNEFQALLVTFAFYIAYVVMALPMSALLDRIGYKKGMVAGLGIMIVGALAFIPAALSAQFGLFLLALFVLGTGLTILQTASNPYLVLLGPPESAAMRICVMGLLNKGAGFIVPIVFTAIILTGMDSYTPDALAGLSDSERQLALDALAHRLIVPYLWMAGMLLVLTLMVKFAPLPEPGDELRGSEGNKVRRREVLAHPQLILGVIALFFYVGVEVIAGDTIGLFGQQLGVSHFGALTSYTMGFMMLGYLLGVVAIPRFLSQGQGLQLSAIAGVLLSVAVINAEPTSNTLSSGLLGWVGVPSVPDPVFYVALLGLANALVWPTVWPLALQGLGRLTATGSALLIMGIAGGALLPLLYGYLAHQWLDSQSAYLMLVPCYGYILFYAFKGHKLRHWSQ